MTPMRTGRLSTDGNQGRQSSRAISLPDSLPARGSRGHAVRPRIFSLGMARGATRAMSTGALLLIGQVAQLSGARADVFLVRNTADRGAGSLRQAILDANGRPGPHTIRFGIGRGGNRTISPLSRLPALQQAVTVDGTTQPGYSGVPLIEIEGSQQPDSQSDGLLIGASDCAVRGLLIDRFGGAGIAVTGQDTANVTLDQNFLGVGRDGRSPLANGTGLALRSGTGCTVRNNLISGNGIGVLLGGGAVSNTLSGNMIGTDYAGAAAVPNMEGVVLEGAVGNTLDGNLLSGNADIGVAVGSNSSDNRLVNNFIGVNAFGDTLPNASDGINIWYGARNQIQSNQIIGNYGAGVALQGPLTTDNHVEANVVLANGVGVECRDGATGNIVGGPTPDAGNVLAGNYLAGASFWDAGTARNRLLNNTLQGNAGYGALVFSSDNEVTGNRITGNLLDGVRIGSFSGPPYAVRVPVRSNAIYRNGDLGIRLDGRGALGGNNRQPWPILAQAAVEGAGTRLLGTLRAAPNQMFEIQVFSNTAPNPSGYGDGEVYVGAVRVTTNAAGTAGIDTLLPPVPKGRYVAATATDPDGNTSAFSRTLRVGDGTPLPVLTNLDPGSTGVGSDALTLTVSGSNFVAGSVVRWNGADRSTRYLSDRRLTAQLLRTDFLQAGQSAVAVYNPPPGGGVSNALTFVITNPAPRLDLLLPASAVAGGGGIALTVKGGGFLPASRIRWNGTDRATTFVSAGELTAQISAGDLAAAGIASVTVFSPGPGGGLSNTLAFGINNPVPNVRLLEPDTVYVGSDSLVLTVNGSGFVPGSRVRWNGRERSTTFVSERQITAFVPTSDLEATDVVAITVTNPAPGGGLSNAVSLPVINPVPVVSGLDPGGVFAGSSPITVRVLGGGFVKTSRVVWNGTARQTAFISVNEVQFDLSRSDLAVPGVYRVAVSNPAPGGGASSDVPFTVVGVPELAIRSAQSARAGGVLVTFTLMNVGSAPATGVSLIAAALDGTDTNNVPALPLSLPDIPVGGTTAAITLSFPAEIPAGRRLLVLEILAGGRAFTCSRLVTVP